MEFYKGKRELAQENISAIGVLLLNMGTPDAPTPEALRPYLKEFLWDKRVIELSRPWWWLVLNLFVLTSRPKRSAALYKKVWMKEGSPLLVYTKKQTTALAAALKTRIDTPLVVDFAMRYGNPSVEKVIDKLLAQGVKKLLVLPLYPQYSGTTTGSSFDAVADALKKIRWVPELKMITEYYDHPLYINALASSVKELWDKEGRAEKLVMSFHGIPERYVLNGDPYFSHCLRTGELLAQALGLSASEYLVCFQSLFGREEWIKPYTEKSLKQLACSGVKHVDLICPGFSADCLETIEEIDQENRGYFLEAGGEKYRYIPALNDRSDFIEMLVELVASHLQGWVVADKQQILAKKIASL